MYILQVLIVSVNLLNKMFNEKEYARLQDQDFVFKTKDKTKTLGFKAKAKTSIFVPGQGQGHLAMTTRLARTKF